MKSPVTLSSGNPIAILGACKRAAVKGGWLLAEWVEFSDTARACLGAECLPEEFASFLAVVEERFAVTRGPLFDPDPSKWAPQSEPPARDLPPPDES